MINNAFNLDIITDVHFFKYVPFITFYRLERTQIPSIGQLVNIDDSEAGIIDNMTN